MSEKCKVEYTSRDIIGNRLLIELANDVDKVAILATEDDLDAFIESFDTCFLVSPKDAIPKQWRELYYGLKQLRKGAFGR